jgi:hypothetical protein
VSVEAISWALNLAPVPADRGGQPSSACKFVLVGLANHAGPDGSAAFPSVATLARYTGLSERTVRTCLDRLEAEGIIRPCDPDIVAARIKRADRRPKGWDLDLGQVREDLAEADVALLEHQFPGLAARLAVHARPGGGKDADGVQLTQPGGAAIAPEPSREPSKERPPPRPRPRAKHRPMRLGWKAAGLLASSSRRWVLHGG